MKDPYSIAVIPGDGIGPEVVEAELLVLKATGVPFRFETFPAGDNHKAKTGVALPDETLRGSQDARAVIFGAVGDTAAEVILPLRIELATWVNLRPVKAYLGASCLYPATDMMIVRENSECLYRGIEHAIAPGVVTATRVITEKASERIARCAFEYATKNGRSKVMAVHKANVLRKSDGLFLECCRRAASDFPDIAYEEGLVDSVAMRMVMDPSCFDVIVTTNMFGDILSDLAAGLIGGLGMCPSANLGDNHALFEPVHGTAPDITGKGLANPAAAIMCGSMLLGHLDEEAAAERVDRALEGCLSAGQTTPDLGGTLATMDMAREVVKRML